MKLQAFAISFMGLTTLACAGTLDDPSRFEQGSQNEGNSLGDGDDEDFDAGVGGSGDGLGGGSGDGLGGGSGDGLGGGSGDGLGGGDGAPAGDGDGAAAGPSCDFTALVETKCGGCHGAATKFGGLDLVSPGVADRVRDVASASTCGNDTLADPADPEQSMLYLRVAGDTCGVGTRMPTSGTLSADEVECFRSWIETL